MSMSNVPFGTGPRYLSQEKPESGRLALLVISLRNIYNKAMKEYAEVN